MVREKSTSPYKIILADPPRIADALRDFATPNLGILYLSSFAKNRFGDRINNFYLETFLSLTEHIDYVKRIQPDIYGISFASYLKSDALITIKKIKSLFPKLLIVGGGPHPTIEPEECFRAGVDVVVFGEGEVTFSEIIERYCFSDERNFNEIDGVAYPKNGKIYKTEKRNLIRDVNSIPFPNWEFATEKKYPGPAKVKRLPYGAVVVSRGCPFNCNFCSNPIWKHNKPWLRLRTPANIAEEIEYLYKRGYRELKLICDEFNSDLAWAKDVCRAIAKLRLRGFYFNTHIRANPIDAEFCDLLKEANCWSVNLGIESANQRVLDGIGKNITIDDVMSTCQLLRKRKMRVFGFFMMFNVWEENNSVKFETSEEVLNTLAFAKKLLRQKLIANMSWGFVSPTPGSRLYETCIKHNLVDKEAYLTSKYDKTTLPIPNVSTAELKKLKQKGYFLQIFYTLKNDLSTLNLRRFRHILSRVRSLVK